MDQNGNRPLEEEFKSSQIYKTLTGAGIPVAERIAQGLNKAAESVDRALNTASPTEKRNARARYYQQPPQPPVQPGPRPETTQTRAAGPRSAQGQQAPGQNGYPYSYHYTYPNGGNQANPQPVGRQRAPWTGAGQQRAQAGQRPQGVTPAPAPQMPQMKTVRRGSPMKFYLTGLAAVLYALWLPLYEPSHFILFSIALVAAFFLSSKIFRGKKEFVPIQPEKPKEEPKKEEKKEEPKRKSTGDPEVDKLIEEGSEYLKKLRAANDAIPDETLSADIERMEKASADIFRFIADHPDKAPQIRKFMNYYLPTTLKLLNSYRRLSSQSVKGENITSTMFNIAGMMHTVADAFEKQLDSLFTDEAMDISADISVFETLLKQEGFVDENAKPQTNNKAGTK